jgi:quinol monooxygenase YgiN
MSVLVHAKVHGLAGRANELRELLAEHARLSARGPGSLGSAAYEPLGAAAGEFVIDTWWQDEAALRAHYGSAEYARYVARVGELLARPSDVQIHYVDRSVRATGDPSIDPSRQG